MKTTLQRILIIITIVSLYSCASEKDYIVNINTEFGSMKAILYDETPQHKENFIKLAKEGFYDSLLFHRVIKNFMIQGGDPDSKNAEPGKRLGNGGPGYTIPAEFNSKFTHTKGALSAARLGDRMNPSKASSGSQFYVVQGKKFDEIELTTDMNQLIGGIKRLVQTDSTLAKEIDSLYRSGDQEGYMNRLLSLSPVVAEKFGVEVSKEISQERLEAYTTVGGAPHLDDEYTVFGKVVEGLDIIDKIAEQPTAPGDRPLKDIQMTVTLEELPKKKITELYGYEYPEVEK